MDRPRRTPTARGRLWGAMLIVAGAGVCLFALVLTCSALLIGGMPAQSLVSLAPGYVAGAVVAVATIAVGAWIATDALLPRGPVRTEGTLSFRDGLEPPESDAREEAMEQQRQLLDDVRHELKTPITIVRGHLETMNVTDPADVASAREIGISELDRMSRLVEDIELLAAVEGGERLSLGHVDLRTLTAHVGELVGVIPGHPWQVAARGDASLHADPDRLVQAWLQLADNAAKYTPEGTPVEIGSHLADGHAQLWVRDHGPGVPPAARRRIFRRFDRAQSGRGVEGSGLGLAIVDAIARAHRGGCAVAATDGGGATFTIRIPVGRATPSAPAPVRAEDVLLQREATR